MSAEPRQEQSIDDVLDQIDWEKLGAEGTRGQAEPSPPAAIEASPPAAIEAPPPAAVEPPPPAHMELFRRGQDIEIVRRWLGWETGLQTVGAVILVWAIFNIGLMRLSENILFFLIFAAGTVGFVYSSLAGWLNRTRILVSRDKITVRHGPIPWPGNQEVDASTVKRLYTEEKVTRSGRGGTRRSYEVHVYSGGSDITLVGGLKTNLQAWFIATQIKKYLGI
jgi:hypothetical protein